MVIETARLILRPFAPDDLDRLAAILADPDVVRYLPGGNPRTREQTDKTLQFIIGHWEQYGFGELGLDRIIALAVPENAASRRVFVRRPAGP